MPDNLINHFLCCLIHISIFPLLGKGNMSPSLTSTPYNLINHFLCCLIHISIFPLLGKDNMSPSSTSMPDNLINHFLCCLHYISIFPLLGKGNMSPSAEFNFFADPEAAHIVLNDLGCPITMACWELCLKYAFSWVSKFSYLKIQRFLASNTRFLG